MGFHFLSVGLLPGGIKLETTGTFFGSRRIARGLDSQRVRSAQRYGDAGCHSDVPHAIIDDEMVWNYKKMGLLKTNIRYKRVTALSSC